MTWREHHQHSEAHAWAADIARARRDHAAATRSFALAAEAEEQALNALDVSKARTYGITVVSAVSLYREAERYADAERLAHMHLAGQQLPDFAAAQLRDLLQLMWDRAARERASFSFSGDHLHIAVRGDTIFRGAAPLDLVDSIAKRVEALLFRVIEHTRKLPYRRRGAPSRDITDQYVPWLVQSTPGSYQFAIELGQPLNPRLWRPNDLSPAEVVERSFAILHASTVSPDGDLPSLVPHDRYRRTFLTIARDLSPTGKRYGALEIQPLQSPDVLTLSTASRGSLNHAISNFQDDRTDAAHSEVSEHGILRAVDHEKDWIKIMRGSQEITIKHVGETVDDLIGPMINHRVLVTASRDQKGTLHFRDIQPDE